MMGFLSTVVAAGAALIIVFFLGVIVLLGIRFYRPGSNARQSPEEADEARMIQEIYRGLDTLDSRVENLESILLHRDEKKDAP
jgi:phage shock protein B